MRQMFTARVVSDDRLDVLNVLDMATEKLRRYLREQGAGPARHLEVEVARPEWADQDGHMEVLTIFVEADIEEKKS